VKTATIERYHVFGTMRHNIRVTYRGNVLTWVTSDPWTRHYADASFYGQESIDAMRQHAKRAGFSHVRFVGDWDKWTKPKGGKA